MGLHDAAYGWGGAVVSAGRSSPEATVIRVWRFEDLPEDLRSLSDHGGDEDWLALIPPALAEDHIGWCDPYSTGPFGCCEISEYEHPQLPGYVVRIGAHS